MTVEQLKARCIELGAQCDQVRAAQLYLAEQDHLKQMIEGLDASKPGEVWAFIEVSAPESLGTLRLHPSDDSWIKLVRATLRSRSADVANLLAAELAKLP